MGAFRAERKGESNEQARSLLILLAALATAVFQAPGPARGADIRTTARPNFLLLFLDNVGYGDLGCYGNAAVKTPNIDYSFR